MRTALRTATAVALLAGVAITTPALTAGAAFAADGPAAIATAGANPSAQQSAAPTTGASAQPSAQPSGRPSAAPTAKASVKPSAQPTEKAPASTAPRVGSAKMLGPCTTEWVLPSVFGEGWTVTLVNDLKKGPSAVLRDPEGKIQGSVDRAHPFDSRVGLKITGADTRNPGFGQRTQGGDTPFRWNSFMRIPANCYATPQPELSGPVKTGDCTVREVITAAFGARWRIVLTNDLRKGPKAVMFDPNGVVMETADRTDPGLGAFGLRIKGANTPTPVLGQRVQDSVAPRQYWRAFPKLPTGCGTNDATTVPAGNGNTTVNTGQTSVIPRGGVAAGAEFAPADDSTALIAAGAGAAAVTAAGLGFVALRRRAAARV
ncbi:hypothetical protein [Streptomyces sp. P9-A4]|uniref:hypothetical protein n=1 Tax=Streptomyces sp. P9-A4 TaxID=3072285 RepID=UPI002FCC1C8A